MTSHSHLSSETFKFLDSLSVCWTRFSEDSILSEELEALKSKFQEPNKEISSSQMKQYIIRAIFLEMFGYETPFIYIHAINLTQSPKFSLKKLGYLACSLFLNETSECLIMLVSSIQRDLKSEKHGDIKLALSVTSRFICPEFIENVHPLINSLINHKIREIRLRSLMVLYQMHKYSPSLISNFEKTVKLFLNDCHIKTLFTVTNIIYEEVKKKPSDYKDILDYLIEIINKIFMRKFQEDQGFYLIKARVLYKKETYELPPPWLLIKMLQIIEILINEDPKKSEKIYQFLNEILRQLSEIRSLATDSVTFQCLKTIFNVYPKEELIIKACDIISIFLTQLSEHKYMALKTLLYLSDQNIKYINQYQDEIISCLENNDYMIKRQTLFLLIKIANIENVNIVIPKLLKYMQMETDEFFKKQLITKIFDLFRKFTPNTQFFLIFGTEFLKFGGNLLGDEIKNEFIRLVYSLYLMNEKNPILICNYFKDLIKYENDIPEALIQISCWVLGEMSSNICNNSFINKKRIVYLDKKEILNEITTIIQEKFFLSFHENETLNWVFNSLIKINPELAIESNPLFQKFQNSKKYDLVQRLKEFQSIKHVGSLLKESHLIGEIDEKLSFLDDYVKKCLASGYKMRREPKIEKVIKKNENNKLDNQEEIETNEDMKIQFKGKKVWGVPEEKIESQIANNSSTNNKFSPNEKKDVEEEIPKPVNVVFSPMEEFASKVFKGVLDDIREKKNVFTLKNKKAIKATTNIEEDTNLVEGSSSLKVFHEYLKNQNFKMLETLFNSIPIFNEIDIELEKLNNEEMQRFSDNFGLKIIKSKTIQKKFVIAGSKSNEMIICMCEDGNQTLKLRFKCTASVILKKMIGFIKEYINVKGYKISEQNLI